MNYRKFYEKEHTMKIPKDWDIHHIDFDHNNNDINNLIAIPKYIHVFLHKELGYCGRKEIEKMIKITEK